ncbi:rCG25391 [Rattus norvegicus]|uniref:RCG25391 n=1 Tax=Rattus norvegicus TaxID=10116 RepID=A6I3Q2_RAT|nr:rCG25391 [Rattus norvegicus]
MILSLFKNQASHGGGKSVRMPMSCTYESFYFLSLILGLVSPTLLRIPYITENDCKINFYGNF